MVASFSPKAPVGGAESPRIVIRQRDGFIWNRETDIKIHGRDEIIEKLHAFGVSEPGLLLDAWIDSFDSSDLTVFQAELLKNAKHEVLEFLEEITEVIVE